MKQINSEAPIKVRKEIIINANNQKVWQVLTNINGWISWNTEVGKLN